jgi:hypothetical protein
MIGGERSQDKPTEVFRAAGLPCRYLPRRNLHFPWASSGWRWPPSLAVGLMRRNHHIRAVVTRARGRQVRSPPRWRIVRQVQDVAGFPCPLGLDDEMDSPTSGTAVPHDGQETVKGRGRRADQAMSGRSCQRLGNEDGVGIAPGGDWGRGARRKCRRAGDYPPW